MRNHQLNVKSDGVFPVFATVGEIFWFPTGHRVGAGWGPVLPVTGKRVWWEFYTQVVMGPHPKIFKWTVGIVL